MISIKNISIRYKIVFIVLAIYILTAPVIFTIFSVNESVRQKTNLQDDAILLARYTAEYCSAPLFFNIKSETKEVLDMLNAIPNLQYAAIYNKLGALYETYNPDNLEIPQSDKVFSSVDSVDIITNSDGSRSIIAKSSIFYNNIGYGSIVLKFSLKQVKLLTRKNTRYAAVIFFVLMITTVFLATIFQKVISEPILALSRVAEKIKNEPNFSIRLKKRNDDEIGKLYDSFNNMLEQIELHDMKRDITEKQLKEAKNHAENADKLKSSFLANMSHEIRTPMNSITGFAGLLAEDDINKEEKQEYIELINSSCNTLLHLIDDILDISKIEAGQIVIKESPVDLSILMNEMYQSFHALNQQSNDNKVDMVLNIPENFSHYTIKSDDIRIKQILSNLISNAIKFTHEGKIEFGFTVVERVRKDTRKRYIKFFVHDSGIGIDEKTQAVIFDRFMKIESDNNKLYRGAGLGLTISKKLVELLGGKIWVESAPQKGSSFYFTVEIIEEGAEDNRTSLKKSKISIEEIKQLLAAKEILITEDDPSNYELLRALLKRTEANISWAKNGLEAINFCIKKVPDLIFMDIKMPDMDGYEAVKKLREQNITVPIIAQTAYARFEDEKDILSNGFNAYLAKPIEKNRLYEIMKKVLLQTYSTEN
ncbi:MAG: response regulator [Bacteroidales bacterium]|nr:response regulator [Bacteroidales bacterium]MBN2821181.1 response regulator [Bacteroidales bacterium]